MNAVGAAHDAKCLRKATLHCIDEGIDTGTIIAQTVLLTQSGFARSAKSVIISPKGYSDIGVNRLVMCGRIDPTRLNPTAFNFDGLVHTNMCSRVFILVTPMLWLMVFVLASNFLIMQRVVISQPYFGWVSISISYG